GRLREALAEPFSILGQEIFLGANIGIALYPTDAESAESVVANAEIAMLRTREEGGAFRYYTAKMNSAAAERLELEAALRRALERVRAREPAHGGEPVAAAVPPERSRRERLARPGALRRRRRGARAGGHRIGGDGQPGAQRRDPAQPEGAGDLARDRRFRDRTLVARLPEPLSARLSESGPIVREGHARRRRQRRHR